MPGDNCTAASLSLALLCSVMPVLQSSGQPSRRPTVQNLQAETGGSLNIADKEATWVTSWQAGAARALLRERQRPPAWGMLQQGLGCGQPPAARPVGLCAGASPLGRP